MNKSSLASFAGRFLSLAVLAAGSNLANAAAGGDIPPLVLPQGVGVNIHFVRGHEADLDMIAAAGFKFVRMDFSWGGTERKKGEYRWGDYDELTANLEKRGLRAIYILDYSNELYEEKVVSRNPITGGEQRDTASPQKPESVAAFARWAAAAALHYKGRGIVWEIWNEPNISFWKPKPDVKQYIGLVQATTAAVRQANPDATIVGPASSEFPWPFLEELLAAPGVLDRLDAVSVHPYRSYQRGPETAAADYHRLRTIIERHAPPNKQRMPILSGEWGYATHNKGVSLETQAAFVARQQLANLWQGVPISIWYDWKNDGADPKDAEQNFGTVTHDLKPKPAYLAVQTLTRELSGYHLARRLETGAADDFVLLFENADHSQKVAAWTTRQPHRLPLDAGLKAADVSGVDSRGQTLSVGEDGGALILNLDIAPQYLTLKKPSRKLTAAAAWRLTSPAPAMVTAGQPGGTSIPIEIRNPFSEAVQVSLNLLWPEGKAGSVVRLEPGETARRELVLQPERRSPPQFSASLTAEWRRSAGELLGASSESLLFSLSNPLSIRLAPLQKGLRLTIDNPSRQPFAGKALIDGQSFPVTLNEGNPEFHREVPGSATQAVTVRLLNQDGRPASAEAAFRFQRLAGAKFAAALDGDSKVSAQASLTETNAPGGAERPSERSWQLRYEFEAGWRFVRCAPQHQTVPPLEGKPRALGMWIFGDNSGNLLRARVTDAGGQTFQPSGPALDWEGWRWVEFDLADLSKAGHWGGANDGTVHGTLRLDTLVLVDSSSRKTSGTIHIADPALVY